MRGMPQNAKSGPKTWTQIHKPFSSPVQTKLPGTAHNAPQYVGKPTSYAGALAGEQASTGDFNAGNGAPRGGHIR